MTKTAYLVTDLGPGDGGKGGVVHKIAHMTRAHTVVKVGGAQGRHGVSTSSGERFAFSQWGCATFEGVRTHISPRMVIHPEGILNEALNLRYGHGIHDPFGLLSIDRKALCATPYHGIASRLKELSRENDPRGTIGTGVGEAYRDAERFPELIIRAGDLARIGLKERLEAVRQNVRTVLAPIIEGSFLHDDRQLVEQEVALLEDDGFLKFTASKCHEVAQSVRITDEEFFSQEILRREGTIVVESSHGVLTDQKYGFHPHTSALRTLPEFTVAMFRDAGYDGRIVSVGVTRAYQIRHGAGPMPTADERMTETLLPGSHKEENRYQGKVRTGPLDFNLLRYAIDVSGGPKAFDALAVTWFDQIRKNGVWHICNRYRRTSNQDLFPEPGKIRVIREVDEAHSSHQEALGSALMRCTPDITSYDVPRTMTTNAVYQFCAEVVRERTGVPVRMVSFGQTERDKMYT